MIPTFYFVPISFTNVAWQEIQRQAENFFGIREIGLPHFLGTIDSFINRYLVFPFGHLIMKCSETPQLVGEPYGSWHASIGRGKDAYNQYFDKITFSINGRIIPTTPLFPNPFIFDPGSFKKENPDGHIRNLIMIKKDNWAKGYFTQADAHYIALQLLRNYPKLAEILVNRFPKFIIDEAQDTSEIHMAIIDILLDHGLKYIQLLICILI